MNEDISIQDVIVIGGGSRGYAAAIRASRLGGKAALVECVEAQNVLVASRKPALADMGIQQLGIELNEDGGIRVNNLLETTVPGI